MFVTKDLLILLPPRLNMLRKNPIKTMVAIPSGKSFYRSLLAISGTVGLLDIFGMQKDNPTSDPELRVKETKPEAGSEENFVKQSSLYQEFLAEREEILKHKWLESERLGYDIGFERALLDWIRRHRDEWRENRRARMKQQRG